MSLVDLTEAAVQLEELPEEVEELPESYVDYSDDNESIGCSSQPILSSKKMTSAMS